jgi:hypothetical protein
VYDPRTVSQPPPWQAAAAAPARAHESRELAHSTDLLPTILGLALGRPDAQPCPVSQNGTACEGHDLRPYLRTPAGAPAPQAPLRHSLCGHHTQRGFSPGRQRYLLTRPGTVGRCVDVTLKACTTAANCAAGEACLSGRCTPVTDRSCSTTAQCPKGSLCLAGQCHAGPPCLDDTSCVTSFGSLSVRCLGRQTKWCRNAPNRACNTAADCPVCPPIVPGTSNPPCGRLCESQQLKLYVGTTAQGAELLDLFADPDERVRLPGDDPLLRAMSDPDGQYRADVRRLGCCVDDWWPEGVSGGSVCAPGFECPADYVCNE